MDATNYGPGSSSYTQQNQEEEGCCSSCYACAKGSALNVVFFISTLVPAAAVVVLGIILSVQGSDLSSQMIVLTGVRTRDWASANAFAMTAPGFSNGADSNEDEHTRLYACMKQTGISVNGGADLSSPLYDYREDVLAFMQGNNRSCEAESDWGWPRDYGFYNCIRELLHLTLHQGNMFLSCLDVSEGIMVESLQTPASSVFLGSYNFIALLLASCAVISVFIIFTVAGFFWDRKIVISPLGNITDYWTPLSGSPAWCAFAVSLAFSVISLFYTFPAPNVCSDVPAQPTRLSFPNTPWTGYLCSSVLLVLTAHLYVFVLEPLEASQPETAKTQSEFTSKFQLKRGFHQGFFPRRHHLSQHNRYHAVHTTMPPHGLHHSHPNHAQLLHPFYPHKQPLNRMSSNALSVHINDPDFFKFVEQATSDSRVSFIHIMPVLIRIFPVCLAYADGLLFVGMLNAANSPLNETVVYLFYYITLCRILQCVSAYLMFDVFEEGSGSDQAHQTTPFAATTLASVFAFVLAAYHFSSCVVYSAALNYIGVLGPIYSLQLSFIILMSCLELSKFILSCVLFFSDDNIMETETYVLWSRGIFQFDWVLRMVFIISAIFICPNALDSQNSFLSTYLGLNMM